MQFADDAHGFGGGACFATNCEGPVGMDHFLEALSKKGMIVNNHDPFRRRWIVSGVLGGRAHELRLSCGWFGWRCRSASHQLSSSSPLAIRRPAGRQMPEI